MIQALEDPLSIPVRVIPFGTPNLSIPLFPAMRSIPLAG